MLLIARALLLPISSVYVETTDEYVAGLKKEVLMMNYNGADPHCMFVFKKTMPSEFQMK